MTGPGRLAGRVALVTGAARGPVIRTPRVAAPRDVSDAVAWLAWDESRTVTGIALPVDLGATAV